MGKKKRQGLLSLLWGSGEPIGYRFFCYFTCLNETN